MGVWPDGYYITYNMFRNGRTFRGSNVCVYERDKMLVGASARQICKLTSTSHASLVPADLEGSTLPPAGSANPLLSISSTALNAWRYKVNWTAGTATLTGPTTLPGVTFSRACGGGACIVQPGTTQRLDSLGDRLNYRLSYRNFTGAGAHESMVINHPVATGGTSGIRWYELRNATGQTLGSATPVVFQQGTFSPDATYRWMGSAAMDKTGGIAVGYNVSSSSVVPSIRYAYRGPTDPAGALGNETNILVGSGSQTDGPRALGRLQHGERRPRGRLHDGLHDRVPARQRHLQLDDLHLLVQAQHLPVALAEGAKIKGRMRKSAAFIHRR